MPADDLALSGHGDAPDAPRVGIKPQGGLSRRRFDGFDRQDGEATLMKRLAQLGERLVQLAVEEERRGCLHGRLNLHEPEVRHDGSPRFYVSLVQPRGESCKIGRRSEVLRRSACRPPGSGPAEIRPLAAPAPSSDPTVAPIARSAWKS